MEWYLDRPQPERVLVDSPGLEPQLAIALQALVDADPRVAVGYLRMRWLPQLGIGFTLDDVCRLSRS